MTNSKECGRKDHGIANKLINHLPGLLEENHEDFRNDSRPWAEFQMKQDF
jgi:hypothetical protein